MRTERTCTNIGRHREKLRISEAAGVAVEIAKTLPVAAYDWVVDATGSPDGLQQAVGMMRPRGTLIMKSTVHGLVGDRYRAADRE